ARVLLELEVDRSGAVRTADVVDVAGADVSERADLERLAREHAGRLRFAPAEKEGAAIAARVRVELLAQAGAVASPGPEPDPEPDPEPNSDAPPPHAHPHVHAHSHPHSPSELHDLSATARVSLAAAPALPVAASQLKLEVAALRAVPRRTAQDYLTLAPGVVLQNHSGVGHANSVFVRGFDAGEGEDLETLVDGMPINEPSNAHAHGYADSGFVIPETIERIDVLQGPFDPRQGDFAVAGSAEYVLGVRERGLRASAEYGSFAERHALLLWAPEDASRGTFVATELGAGDGFGPNRAHSQLSGMARYEHDRGPVQYSVLGAAHASRYDSAGVLREDDYDARRLPCDGDEESQFFCTYDPHQGGSSARGLINGSLSWLRLGRELRVQAYFGKRGFRERESFTGFLLDERGDGVEQRYDADTLGLRSSYALQASAWGQRQRLELGMEGRQDFARTRMWRLRREGGIPYATVFDDELSLTHGAAYVRGELVPVSWLAIMGGVRGDAFGFSSLDLNAPSSDRVGERLPVTASDAWGSAFSPRASVRALLLPPLHWVVSAGSGVRSSDAQALSQSENAPFARALAAETGPVLELAPWPWAKLTAQAFGFVTRVEQELLFDPQRARNVPAGDSSRYGVAGTTRLQVGQSSDTLLSVAYAEARAIDEGTGFFALGKGAVLPFVPRFVARADHASTWRLRALGQPLALTGALGVGLIGARPLPLGASSEPVLDVGLRGLARLGMFELGLSVENLFDARQRVSELNHVSQFDPDGAASLRAARHFAAGAPRRWLGSLTVYLDEQQLGIGAAP
ncbi:MAG TPA: TonB-dependent receptor, partial [Polyangiales bacterium]|nr:TonB-dependent receptor [Polyangiales bacterium]